MGPALQKWVQYFNAYDKHLARFRGQNVTVVEVGVQSGGSIPMWQWYFGDGLHYVGIDINPLAKQFEGPNVDIVIGDAGSKGFWTDVKRAYPTVHVMIDDGGHTMSQQLTCLENMLDHVAEDGVFLIEGG